MKLKYINFSVLWALFFIATPQLNLASAMDYAVPEERTLQLIEAAQNNNLDLVNASLMEEVEINRGHHMSGFSALHYAALHGNVEMISTLLEHGANINLAVEDKTETGTWNTPLLIAAKNRHVQAVVFLLNNGAEISQENVYKDTTPSKPVGYSKGKDNSENKSERDTEELKEELKNNLRKAIKPIYKEVWEQGLRESLIEALKKELAQKR